MAWIKTVPMAEADEDLRRAMETQKALYPVEYATPVHPGGRRRRSDRRVAQPYP